MIFLTVKVPAEKIKYDKSIRMSLLIYLLQCRNEDEAVEQHQFTPFKISCKYTS